MNSLLSTGYDRNVVNTNGDTALSLSVKSRNVPLIKLLLDYGVVIRDADREVAEGVGLAHLLLPSSPDGPQAHICRLPRQLMPDETTIDARDGPGSCQYCNVQKWITSRGGVPFRHWSTFGDLQTSAQNGCSLCNFFRQEFESQRPNYIGASETRILVTLHRNSDQSLSASRKGVLAVSMGKSARLGYELCCFNGKWEIGLPLLL